VRSGGTSFLKRRRLVPSYRRPLARFGAFRATAQTTGLPPETRTQWYLKETIRRSRELAPPKPPLRSMSPDDRSCASQGLRAAPCRVAIPVAANTGHEPRLSERFHRRRCLRRDIYISQLTSIFRNSHRQCVTSSSHAEMASIKNWPATRPGQLGQRCPPARSFRLPLLSTKSSRLLSMWNL
jgi:hypothetical protein